MSVYKYDVSNPERHFRQAASIGHVAEMKRLLQFKQVDINAAGQPSGKTALHQAAKNGKINAVLYLLQEGAAQGKDNGHQTPADLTNNEEIKTLLAHAPIAFKAIDFAQKLLPKDSALSVFKNTAQNKLAGFNRAIDKKYNELSSQSIEVLRPVFRHLTQQEIDTVEFFHNVIATLHAVNETGYNVGTCGLRNLAATGYIIDQNPHIAVETLSMFPPSPSQAIMINGLGYSNHATLMLNRHDAGFSDNAKGHFIYCDAFQDGQIYTNTHPCSLVESQVDSNLCKILSSNSYIPENANSLPVLQNVMENLRSTLSNVMLNCKEKAEQRSKESSLAI